MKLKIIQADNAPNAIGPYSQAIAADSLLFVSGQIGINPKTGELISLEFSEQAEQSLENLKNIVQAAGGNLNTVLSVDVFLTDIKKFAEFNDIYSKYFSQHRPARAVIEVSGLPKGALIEIKCVASVAG